VIIVYLVCSALCFQKGFYSKKQSSTKTILFLLAALRVAGKYMIKALSQNEVLLLLLWRFHTGCGYKDILVLQLLQAYTLYSS
jgi:hypothetical protein